MKTLSKLIIFFVLSLSSICAYAQADKADAFAPICKYLARGDAESLSAWFADNLEVSILTRGDVASKTQAKQMLKSFFSSYTPRSFELTHTSGRANMKYALGNLNAGGENFLVTVFVSCRQDAYCIQQLKIERH